MNHVHSWVKTFDDLGIDGLKHNSFSKQWTVEQRFDLVAKVLSGDSIINVAKNAYINPCQLYQWVKKYREKGKNKPNLADSTVNRRVSTIKAWVEWMYTIDGLMWTLQQ